MLLCNHLNFAAYELKAWLLYYSPVVLYQILNEDFYQHHLLLVEGVYLLLMNNMSEKQIEKSARLLQHYYVKFGPLYGKFKALGVLCRCNYSSHSFMVGDRYCTTAVHGLLHLPDVVRSLGPLWAHSCFPFEGTNGTILKLFHGSKAVEKQVKLTILHKVILNRHRNYCMAHPNIVVYYELLLVVNHQCMHITRFRLYINSHNI